jgi:hypothetical protein
MLGEREHADSQDGHAQKRDDNRRHGRWLPESNSEASGGSEQRPTSSLSRYFDPFQARLQRRPGLLHRVPHGLTRHLDVTLAYRFH